MRTLMIPTVALLALAACGDTATTPPAATPAPSEPAPSEPAPSEPAPATPAPSADASPALRDPSQATLTAPEQYTVRLETTEGEVLIDVTRAWAPLGADRFYNLVKAGFYDDTAFFRVVPGFVVQIGIHGDPEVAAAWRQANLQDDPTGVQTNARGTVTFATGGPNTRTTQIFVNLADNGRLDGMGFTPFGRVRDMAPIDAVHAGYGERPNQMRLQTQGNAYLRSEFPELDYIQRATVVE